MDPDIHWSAMSGHVSTFIVNGGRYDHIFWTEDFNAGMQTVLDNIEMAHPVDLAQVPRFNESEGHGPKRAHPVEAYFDDLSMHLVYEIYKRDFELFRYDFEDPSNKMPKGEIDLDEVPRDKLGDCHAQLPACGVSPERRRGLRRAVGRTTGLGRGLSRRPPDAGRAQPVFGLRRGGDRLGRWRDRVLGSGALTWSLDLGDANATEWVTQIGLSTYQIDAGPGASTSDRQSLRLRTGPQFQLTGEAFGPRLQPYVELRIGPLSRRRASDYDAASSALPTRTPIAHMDQFRRRLHRLGRAGRLRRRYRFHDVSLGADLPPLARGVLSPDPVDGQRGHRDARRGPARPAPRLRPRLRRARALPGPTGAPGPSPRSTGSTSPTPAWPGTRR
jgi:hypothetical protein